MYNFRIVLSKSMSQISPDNLNTKNCSLKRKISPVRETEKGESTPIVRDENSKRCKLDENSRPGFALHALELNPDQQNNEGKVMSSLIEKIISNLSINRDSKIAEFNQSKPILLTIPMIIKREDGVEKEKFFFKSKSLK